jgi:beta-lactamase regulating signal transducer with metallopeptidase domain
VTATLLADVTVRAVAAALLHSLWQGALVAAVTGVMWRALRHSRPTARYALGCVALALMVGGWAATAWRTAVQLLPDAPARASLATPRPALGPGLFDYSPAIRTISLAELEDVRIPLARRLDVWSVRLVPLWLAGVFGLSFRLALSWWLVQRMRRVAHTPVASFVSDHVAALAAQLRVSRTVQVVQSAAVQVPAVIGWVRPVILLPVSALTGLNLPQLDAILAHELAHVRRHDFAVNLLQTAAEVLLFYHPACWWISRRVRAERELCCDDIAVSVCGDRLLYATALADLEALRVAPTLALAATDGPLLQRVRRLLSPSPEGSRGPGLSAALVPAALLALVMTGATLTAAPARPGPPQNETAAPARTVPAGHGVVRGQIVDAQSGRPVAGANYEITGPEDSALGKTGDDGRFETRPVKAGTYTMSARAKGYVMGWYGQRESPFGAPIDVRAGRVSSGIEIRMQAAGSINGRVVDGKGNGLHGVEIVLEAVTPPSGGMRNEAAFAQTVEDGAFRVTAAPGDYYVRAYVGEPLHLAKGQRSQTYLTTFYPGARVKEEAQPLHVDAGLDLYDVDFTLATGDLVRVRGRVVDPSGDSLAGLRVAAMSMSGGPRGGRENSVAVDAEGRFEIRDLVPGQYMIDVWDQRRTARWLEAMKTLTLNEDVDDLEMRASNGAQVAGRIVRDPASTGEVDFAEVRIGFEKRMTENGFNTAGGAPIAADGTFETEAPGGLVTINVEFVPEGWTIKSIHLDRVDVDGQAVDMSGGTRQLQIVLTDRRSAVAGMVVDRNGRTLAGYSVVLFADDERRWTPNSRFVLSARSSQTGQFRLKDVPPGDYLAVAVKDLPFRAWTNPDVLIRLQSIATKLTVTEAEQKTISIRASATPDNLPGR